MVGALLMLLVLAILTPALVFLLKNESRMAARKRESTVAFYAAEAGVERALWMLRTSTSTFDEILGGSVPSGYLRDATYADINAGTYVVLLSSTGVSKEIRVESTGRDDSARELRTIEVLLKKDIVPAVIFAATVRIKRSAQVFWGPIMATTSVDVQNSADQLYPRKMSRGRITAGDNYPDRDTDPSAPNTDRREWWSYDSYPVPDAPAIDLDYYRTQAQISPNYYTNGDMRWNKEKDNTEMIRFVEGNCQLEGDMHMRGWLFCTGDVTIDGKCYEKDDGQYGDYTVAAEDIPQKAHLEYRKNTPSQGMNCRGYDVDCDAGGPEATNDGDYADGDDADGNSGCCYQFPGDNGRDGEYADFRFKYGAAGCDSSCQGGPNAAVCFKGLVYAGRDCHIDTSAVIHGVVVCQGDFEADHDANVFYDESLDIKMSVTSFNQTSWRELIAKTF
ncbi:MAG: PilX N-terminal domain-containing pilus assembly protein [Elusimicrobiota bacterium]